MEKNRENTYNQNKITELENIIKYLKTNPNNPTNPASSNNSDLDQKQGNPNNPTNSDRHLNSCIQSYRGLRNVACGLSDQLKGNFDNPDKSLI